VTHKEDQLDNKPAEETKLLDVRKAKFVQRSGGQNDAAACSLINVTDIAIRWEPDPYLELLEVATRLKAVLYRMKLQNSVTEVKDDTLSVDIPAKKEDRGQQEKAPKKRESVIAVDLESLKISGEFADGVEAMVQVGSIFSENAKIGVLIEALASVFVMHGYSKAVACSCLVSRFLFLIAILIRSYNLQLYVIGLFNAVMLIFACHLGCN